MLMLDDYVENALLTASRDELLRSKYLIEQRLIYLDKSEDEEEEKAYVTDSFDDEEPEEDEEYDEE